VHGHCVWFRPHRGKHYRFATRRPGGLVACLSSRVADRLSLHVNSLVCDKVFLAVLNSPSPESWVSNYASSLGS
jgi:hypothetical protein